jgi:uncharacterized protein (TIGR02246 family)
MERALAVLLILVFQFAEGQTSESRNIAGQSDQQQAIRDEVNRLNTQEVEALVHKDLKTLSHLWSDDFVVTNPLNKFVSKRDVIELIESNVLGFTSYDRQVEYVRLYGDTVIVAGRETVVWAGKMPNAGKTSHLRFTAVWMKQDGRWREVSRHANIIDPQ